MGRDETMATHQETATYMPVDLEGPGVLYRTILAVARATNPESFGIEVCERERVDPHASLEDDLRMIRRRLPRHANGESWIVTLLRQIPILRDILGLGEGEVILDPQAEILAGAHYLLFVAYNKHAHQPVRRATTYQERSRAVPPGPVPASLALVLKAKELPEGLTTDESITRDTAQEMLEKAIRYAAFPLRETGERESGLSLGPVDRAAAEENIYVGLEIDDGGDLIGVRTKTKLRSLLGKSRSRSLRIRAIGLLERLSDLRGFSS
jgi:hypothetical protein